MTRIDYAIDSTMIDKGGLFTSTTVEYVIETQPMKWTVARKFDDALWLRDQLQRLHPAIIVIYLLSCFSSFLRWIEEARSPR